MILVYTLWRKVGRVRKTKEMLGISLNMYNHRAIPFHSNLKSILDLLWIWMPTVRDIRNRLGFPIAKKIIILVFAQRLIITRSIRLNHIPWKSFFLFSEGLPISTPVLPVGPMPMTKKIVQEDQDDRYSPATSKIWMLIWTTTKKGITKDQKQW